MECGCCCSAISHNSRQNVDLTIPPSAPIESGIQTEEKEGREITITMRSIKPGRLRRHVNTRYLSTTAVAAQQQPRRRQQQQGQQTLVAVTARTGLRSPNRQGIGGEGVYRRNEKGRGVRAPHQRRLPTERDPSSVLINLRSWRG